LLQNWFKNKLFVEVSVDYFHHCRGAKIRYVYKTLTSFGNCDEMVSSFVPFAETCVDKSEKKLKFVSYSTVLARRKKIKTET
jgi:hypothetical protein